MKMAGSSIVRNQWPGNPGLGEIFQAHFMNAHLYTLHQLVS